MKIILSLPDEDYSRNASCVLNFISTVFFFSSFFFTTDERIMCVFVL